MAVRFDPIPQAEALGRGPKLEVTKAMANVPGPKGQGSKAARLKRWSWDMALRLKY